MNYLKSVQLRTIPCEISYPFDLPFIKSLRSGYLDFRAAVTFFVGENGSGKSTLLEAIAIAMGFNAEGGSRDFQFSTKATHSSLSEYLSTVKGIRPKDGFFLRAESFYNVSSYLDENSTMIRYGGVSFHEQSHGEAFLALIQNRFEGNGLYILDEPEAALSPRRLLSLLASIDELVKKNSQFIIATHSPILMAYPGAVIYEFSEKGIQKTDYKQTDHYFITKQFLNHPEQMIKYLLTKNDELSDK